MEQQNNMNGKQPADAEQSKKSQGKKRDEQLNNEPEDAIQRLQASGRMALNAMTSNQTWSGQVPGTKSGAGPSRTTHRPNASQEASAQRIVSSGIIVSFRNPSSSGESSQSFEEFTTRHSALDEIPIAGEDRIDRAAFDQEAADGLAVAQLLNAPEEHGHYEPEDDSNTELSQQELEKLREALFASNVSHSDWDNLLNFTPEFLRSPSGHSAESQLHMGIGNQAEGHYMWLQQWGDVLSSYTDQVWGDLGPLAAKARRELEELQSQDSASSKPPRTKALHRLQMLLAHVRGH